VCHRNCRNCTLIGHFGERGVMQIAEDAGAFRIFIGIRDPRFDAVAGRAYDIAPVPVRDGTADLRHTPITARGMAHGYIMTLRGEGVLNSMAKSRQIRFALAGGGSVMTLTYGAIGAQMDDLKQCARDALRGGVGTSSLIGA
jgi:hypothetical protein